MQYPNGFDRTKAIQLAELVRQAYHQFEAFRNNGTWRLSGDYTLVTELKYSGARGAPGRGFTSNFLKELSQLAEPKSNKAEGLPIGFIALKRSDAYLIFRGTMTAAEWIRDFKIRLLPYPYRKLGNVHDGFIQTYDAFRNTIHHGLAGAHPRRRLYIAGHSLGAALATLAAPDVASTMKSAAVAVYTFASPRVGDKAFAAQFNRIFPHSSFRIANSSDMVVSVPFPVPFLRFLGGYFTHVDAPVDFTIQEEDVEKNHDLRTYLSALKADAGRRGVLRSIFK